MGVIEIRNRKERLGNLGGVRMADTNVGAARAFAGMAEAARARGENGRRAGDALAGLGNAARNIIATVTANQERRDNEMADIYVARYQQGMDAYNNGTADAAGNRVKGAMEADFGDSGLWLEDNVAYRDRFGARLGKELKMSDRAMEIAKRRLVGYDLHMQNRWQRRAAQVDDARALAAANENFNAMRSTALDVLVDGDHAGGAPVALALDDYSQALERALDAAHVPAEARPEARRKAALQFCQDALARRLRRCEEEALVSPDATEEYVRGQFDAEGLEGAIRDNGLVGVFPFVAARAGSGTEEGRPEGGDGADVLREHLKGADTEALASAALKDAQRARDAAVAKARARRAEQVRAVGEKATRAEMELFGDTAKANDLTAYYEGLGKLAEDGDLKRLDPARALRLAERSQSGLASLAKQKRVAADRETKGRAAVLKEALEQKAQWLLVPKDGATDEELGRWHESRAAFAEEVEAAFLSGNITAAEFGKLRADLSKTYDAEWTAAINLFDASFGLDRRRGLEGPSDVTRYLEKDNELFVYGRKVHANVLASYRDQFLFQLDMLRKERPTANMRELAGKAAAIVKSVVAQDYADIVIGSLLERPNERYWPLEFERAREEVVGRANSMHDAARPVAQRLYPRRDRPAAENEGSK